MRRAPSENIMEVNPDERRDEFLKRMGTLLEATAGMLGETTACGLLERLMNSSRSLTDAKMGAAAYGYENGQFKMGCGTHPEICIRMPVEKPYCICSFAWYIDHLMLHGRLSLSEAQIRKDLPEGPPIKGFLGVRMIDRSGRATGVILVADKQTGEFTQQDEAILAQLAAAASLALENIEASLDAQTRAAESDNGRRRLAEVLSNITDCYFSTDSDWRLVEMNPLAEHVLFGRPAEELIGQNLFEAHPGFSGNDFERHFRGAAENAQTVTFDAEDLSGETWFECHAYPSDKHLEIYLRDINRRKRAEKALRDAVTELAASNRELEQFAYVASHDLQEPLRMISSYLQLLEEHYIDKLSADARDFIDFAVDGAARMQALISDLLAFSRVGTRGRPFERMDSGTALEQTISNLSDVIAQTAARVTHEQLPVIWGDRQQWVQLFQNLLDNALKFRNPHAPPEIAVSACPDGRQWTFCVRDNGIGIESADLERIFNVFTRLHSRKEYPGTGIGLAICKKIVERHGGRIWVESSPGQGSSFYFTVPMSRRQPQETSPPAH